MLAALDSPPPDDNAVKAGGSVAPHRLYNLGNNRSEPLLRLVEAVEAACGRKAELILLPMQPGDVAETYADIEDAARDFGYRPRTAIDEGVPRFVDWYQSYRR